MFLGAWSSSVTVPLRKLKAMCWGSFIHCWEVLRHLRVLDLPRNKGSVNPVKKETEKTLLIQVPLPWRINALYKKPVKKVSLLVFAGFCVTNLKPLLLENRSRFPVWFKLLLYCSWWGVIFIFVSQRTANPRAWNTNGSSMIYVICLLVMCPRWCTSWLLAWKEISLDVTVLQVVWGKLWNAEKTWWCVQVRWGVAQRKNESLEWAVRPFCPCPFMIHSVHERFGCLWSSCSGWGACFHCLWKRAEGSAGEVIIALLWQGEKRST